MIGTIVELICLMFTFDTLHMWLVLLITALTGYFFIPQIPIFLEFGCELVFPIG